MTNDQTTTKTIQASDDWSVSLMALGVQALLGARDFQIVWETVETV
jgi:hypothetical protein